MELNTIGDITEMRKTTVAARFRRRSAPPWNEIEKLSENWCVRDVQQTGEIGGRGN
jgi:hypothetical protein